MPLTASACHQACWDDDGLDDSRSLAGGGIVSTQPAWLLRPGCLLSADEGFVEGGAVVVRGSRIESVLPPGLHGWDGPVLEAPEATLLPGLFDSHVHLTFSADGEVVANLLRDDHEGQVARAMANARQALLRGVVTLADCGGRTDVMLDLRARLRAPGAVGPRVLVSGSPITAIDGHCHWLGGAVADESAALALARDLITAEVDFVKVMFTGGNLTAGSDPRLHQFDAVALGAISAVCRQSGRALVVHAHTEAAVRLAAEAGVTVIAHGTCLSPEGAIGINEATVAALRASGTAVDATITVGARTDFPGAGDNAIPRHLQREAMLPVFREMAASDIAILAGTDAGVPGVAHGDIAASIVALTSEVGMPLEQALAAATRLPAQAYGLADTTGSIALGLKADLLLVDGDVRVDLTALQRPSRVWRSGQLLVRDGEFAAASEPAFTS